MLSERQLFLQFLAQTSDSPLLLDIVRSEGVYLFDREGNKYLDLISGISVSHLGHRDPRIINAIKKQLDDYLYLMVYGEYIQSPQVKLAQKLTSILPSPLNSTYFVNSGSEANEGAMKLAKRYTGRNEIIACKNAYHGSSHGALSVMGNEYFKRSFRPLLPGIRFIEFNNPAELSKITDKTACVIIEPVQGEAGVRIPSIEYLHELRKCCIDNGALLVFDEVQTGFGRTGDMFAMNKFNVTPDIVTLAKSLGGGMPLGAFVSSSEIMGSLSNNPVLGHITTFGGHPVSCAAALASINILINDISIFQQVKKKEAFFKRHLVHPMIKEVRGIGLMLAVDLHSEKLVKKVIEHLIRNGIITDWFLFAPQTIRIAPPLVITDEQVRYSCEMIIKALSACND